MTRIYAMMRLTRIDSSLLAFLAVFLPLFMHTGDLRNSFGRAIPILFICICTYIANDLDDLEKDCVNHPERPLPSGHLSPTFAAASYFLSLMIALFSINYVVTPHMSLIYYMLIIIAISYRFVVEFIPGFKAPYVALSAIVPVLILTVSYSDKPRLYAVAGATFFHILGREVCMNILDRTADPISFMHRFNPTHLAIAGFALKMMGLLLIATQLRNLGDIAVLLSMILLLGISGLYWFKFINYEKAIGTTKIQMLLGVFFLV